MTLRTNFDTLLLHVIGLSWLSTPVVHDRRITSMGGEASHHIGALDLRCARGFWSASSRLRELSRAARDLQRTFQLVPGSGRGALNVGHCECLGELIGSVARVSSSVSETIGWLSQRGRDPLFLRFVHQHAWQSADYSLGQTFLWEGQQSRMSSQSGLLTLRGCRRRIGAIRWLSPERRRVLWHAWQSRQDEVHSIQLGCHGARATHPSPGSYALNC